MDSLNLLAQEKIHRNDFKDMLKNSEKLYYLRHGILELMKLVEKHKIPLYIVSGGVTQLIEESLILSIPNYQTLKEMGLIYIISNKFQFDDYGYVNGLEGGEDFIVFTFNKAQIMKKVVESINKSTISSDNGIDKYNFENVILLGDHINVYF